MNPNNIAALIAEHETKLQLHDQALESQTTATKELADQLKWILRVLITTLLATVGGLVTQLFKH